MKNVDMAGVRFWYCGRRHAEFTPDWVADANKPADMLREAVSIANRRGRLRGGDRKTWTRLLIVFDAYGLAYVVSDKTSWRSIRRLIADDPEDIDLVYVGSRQRTTKSTSIHSDMWGRKFVELLDALNDAWRGNPVRGRRAISSALQEVLTAAREVWPDDVKDNAILRAV